MLNSTVLLVLLEYITTYSKNISLALWLWQAVNPDIAVITIQIYRGPV